MRTIAQEIQQQSINDRVMFLITRFELGSCFDKYDFNLEDVFRQVSIHFYNKYGLRKFQFQVNF